MVSQKKVDGDTEQMFALVGRAITQWSFVEEALSNIFKICVAPSVARRAGISYLDSGVPMAIFYALESFRPRLTILDAALLARLHGTGTSVTELREEWARLKEKTRKLSRRRNRLAHWTVVPGFEDEEEYWEPRLAPAYGSPAWWTSTADPAWSDSLKPLHVEHMRRAFCIIDERLRGFATRLALSPELSERFDRLTVRQIRSLDRLNPTRAERIRREIASQT
jgi:hypothetical protein